MAEDVLADRARALADKLQDSRKKYERNLAARLREVADEPMAGRRAKVRRSLSLYDWNWFQTEVNISQTLGEAFRDHPDARLREVVSDFEKDLSDAREAQDVLKALLES